MLVKELHSICQHIWETQQWPQDWKRSVFLPVPEKSSGNDQATAHPSKVILRILHARLQQCVNRELPDGKLALEKAEEPEIKLPTSVGSSKKHESSRKTSPFTLVTIPKPLF